MDNSWTLPLRRVPQKEKKDSHIVWNNVNLCYEQKLFGQVTSASYNNSGSLLSCTSSNQVVILRVPQTDGVLVNEQTEKKNYSIAFRDDDKLYVQCVDQRVVVKSPDIAFERQFTGHTREVRRAIFAGRHNIVSASDDTTVKLWDMTTEGELGTGRAHTDYVRSLIGYTGESFFSGSYDHSINLWDPRAGLAAPIQFSKSALQNAVESLCYMPDLNTLACGSGDQIALFDPRKGISVPFYQASLHTKSVVALSYSSRHKTLLSGSLDNRVKMLTFVGEELQCIATKKFDEPVTAIAVHPASTEFAVASASGDLKIFVFREEAQAKSDAAAAALGAETRKLSKEEILEEKMLLIQQRLSTYQYGKALKSALYARQSDVLVSTVEELIRRGALHIALNNQNDRCVVQMLRFATEFVDKPQFINTMIPVFEVIFEIYGSSVGTSTFLHKELVKAQKKISQSLACLRAVEKSMGVMQLIINCD
ncbi:U3 small nucleolar RNA-associated protein 15 [Strigomonas culicis]|uniref:U3 small nucleolar RNA-associated protein 15 n=1 Tax=Strigomonas culicis TaxID=28005 RepID=S9UAK8_9TRYP|nr:U3 small nucleolar RNA-associated protein 15 [Strigomonas culicis]EPY20832.1 U3 small nucleolar RNA-associated protein 15 [Strigomonas culicis]EPY27827.1 U3 small nucleolar RNA-associated protein 15 [Strigomonas culicis]|eukprot:EPY19918.1 U3 small nucleolar RNA-associated protein 15 [Strigomonas culicis]